MKAHRTYDFNAEARPRMPETVRELLIDGWDAYYRWQPRLRKNWHQASQKQRTHGPKTGSIA